MSKKPTVTENYVKDKIKQILEIFGRHNAIYTLTPMTMGYGESGHPDRLLLINGTLIGIEAKRDRNNHHSRPELKAKPNEVMQKRQAEKIVKAGGEWVCIHNDNLQDLVHLLDRYAAISSLTFTEQDIATLNKIVGL